MEDSFVWSRATLEDVDIYINSLNWVLMVLNTGIMQERLVLCSRTSHQYLRFLLSGWFCGICMRRSVLRSCILNLQQIHVIDLNEKVSAPINSFFFFFLPWCLCWTPSLESSFHVYSIFFELFFFPWVLFCIKDNKLEWFSCQLYWSRHSPMIWVQSLAISPQWRVSCTFARINKVPSSFGTGVISHWVVTVWRQCNLIIQEKHKSRKEEEEFENKLDE